jgi:DNA-binding MarR family transcriptional regulator
LPKLANMHNRQITFPDLPIRVDLGTRTATARLTGSGAEAWTFRLHRAEHLTASRVASEVLPEADDQSSTPMLVYFAHASRDATRLLREHRISFIGEYGECFLFSPPLVVDRQVPAVPKPRLDSSISDDARNPFGRRGSRVLRWLLLHPHEEFSMHDLAHGAMVSGTLVSRVTRALSEEGWIDLEPDADDRRVRRVRMRRPRESLAAWGRAWERRRIPVEGWGIRSDGFEATMRKLKRARSHAPGLQWALGGLAGAALVRRVVEPESALLWVPRHDLRPLEEVLLPTRSANAYPQLRVATAPDDFIFDLVEERNGLPVADRVQLWLDCSQAGERGMEAADAIAKEMGW